ncbi:hypothetical protein HY768_10870 [candidate division TA06 bacterium]|uniref:Uncharacterized protein n=1 Tax=candidate division TA06 bacterium TaxID=2250710 RepID=A0A933MLE4_UNCT6|nr:hypothetical protein [candidate division TA06 bacterium]
MFRWAKPYVTTLLTASRTISQVTPKERATCIHDRCFAQWARNTRNTVHIGLLPLAHGIASTVGPCSGQSIQRGA